MGKSPTLGMPRAGKAKGNNEGGCPMYNEQRIDVIENAGTTKISGLKTFSSLPSKRLITQR